MMLMDTKRMRLAFTIVIVMCLLAPTVSARRKVHVRVFTDPAPDFLVYDHSEPMPNGFMKVDVCYKFSWLDTDTNYLINLRVPLAGEMEYHQNEFDFEFHIPPNILQPKEEETVKGALKDIGKQALFGGSTKTGTFINWVIAAHLDIPGLDLKKTTVITVSE